MNLNAIDLRSFVPAKDFSASKQFYLALGCKLEWEDENLALFELASQRFYLHRHFVSEWAENCMLFISVVDAFACHREIDILVRSEKHPGIRAIGPKVQPYGALVTHVWDPSGVLIHLAQWPLNPPSPGS